MTNILEADGRFRVGSFLVEEKIGAGGMGDVYLARHQLTGAAVALKVTRPAATTEGRAAFNREVEAHARLRHPNVVCLFDVGEVDPECEARSEGELQAGSGFIAMELARGVVSPAHFNTWEDVQALILQTLDGLAYAHARSMIHRDLKPENLLRFEGADGRRIKLADFGISVAFEARREGEVADLENITGTPLYMAPEQIRADWPQFGPWTDIYALGCLVWELVCGRPPFLEATMLETLRAHLEAPRPELVPRFRVPDGLDGWLRRAMAVSPVERFRRAADAGRALTALGNPAPLEDPPPGFDVDDENSAKTWTHTLAPLMDASTLMLPTMAMASRPTRVVDAGARSTPSPVSVEGLFASRPPIPATWREGRDADGVDQFPAGLGLFPLRGRPLIGRAQERDVLWGALRRASTHQRAEVVLIEGARGDGTTALVDWLGTRARELGAAGVLRADFDHRVLDAGFRGLVRRLYHAWGMSRGRLYEFILDALPPLHDDRWREADARALTEVAIPYASDPEGPMFEFAGPDQKLALAARLLLRLGRLNLPILICDNSHADIEARTFVEYVAQAAWPPCLVVVGLRREALDDRPALRSWVETLKRAPNVSAIELQPLEASEHRQLIDRLLPLAPGLAEKVSTRTLGSPGFAVQMVTDWVERGLLTPGEHGYDAEEEGLLPIPDDAHAVCLGRIERALRNVPGDDDSKWRALELAALLGARVDREEWRSVAGDAVPLEPLIAACSRAGIAKADEATFEFAFGLLREALHRRAAERGRLKDHHRACAAGLVTHPGEGETRLREADHWLAAGDGLRALEIIERAGRELLAKGLYQRWAELVERHEDIVEEMSLENGHPRRLDAEIARAHVELLEYDQGPHAAPFAAARAVATRVHTEAVRRGHEEAACKAKRLLAIACLRQGDLATAVEAGRGAVEHARRAPTELCDALVAYGDALRRTGAFEEALGVFTEAERSPHVSPFISVFVQGARASIARAQGDLLSARRDLISAAADAKKYGQNSLEGKLLNELGDVARALDDFAEARRYYVAARAIGEQIARPVLVAVADLNLALTALFEGDPETAADRLNAVGEVFVGTGIENSVKIIEFGLRASRGDWAAVDAGRSEIQRILKQSHAVSDDVAVVRLIVSLAQAAGQSHVAEALAQIVEGDADSE